MKRNFLLMLLLTLLPLTGWAQWSFSNSQTIEWKDGSTTKEISEGTTPDFSSLVIVKSTETATWGMATATKEFDCESLGLGTTWPTGDNARYYYNVYADAGSSTPITTSPLPIGDYVLRLYVRYVSGTENPTYSPGVGWNITNANSWANAPVVNLPLKVIAKPEVTVTVYSITKTWDDPWAPNEPTMDLFNTTPELRKVEGGSATWNDVKDYLQYKRVDNGTDVGSYSYTLALKSVHPSYVLHISDASAKLNITQATNVINTVNVDTWTYGDAVADATDKITVNANYGAETATFEFFKGTESLGATIPTDAGNYTVVVTIPETINYTETTSTQTFTIDKADTPLPVITAVGGPFTYKATIDESAFTVTKTSDGALSYTYAFKAPGASSFVPATSFNGAAGTWKVYAHQEEGTNWNALDDVTGFEFTVAPKELKNSMLATFHTPQTYDGTQITTGYQLKDGAATLVNNTDFTYTITYAGSTINSTQVKNAGTYTYTFTGKGNYTSSFTTELVVNKADWPTANITDPTLLSDWTYNGTEYNLITAPAEAIGVIAADVADAKDFVYYLNDVETPIADIKAKNANENPGYKVSYSIKETANYNAVAKKDLTPVIVEKAPLTITGATLNGVYTEPLITYSKEQLFFCDDAYFATADKANGQAIAASLINIKLVDGTNEIVIGDDPVALEAGNYTVQLTENTAATVQNYKIKTLQPGVLAIAQADNEITGLAVVDWTYGDTPNDPTYTASFKASEEPTFTYAVKGSTEFTAEVPVNAGEYTVKATIEETKNYKGAEATADFTIDPKDLDNSFFALTSDEPLVFTGANQKSAVKVVATDGDPNIITADDFEETKVEYNSTKVTELVNAGTYTFTFTGKGNYTGTATATIGIAQKPIDDDDVVFALNPASVEYDGAEHKTDVNVVPTAPLTADDYEVVLPTTMINADEYTITLNGKGNYTSSTTATFTIAKKALNASFFVLNGENPITFDGSDQIPGFTLLSTEPIKSADFTVATTNSDDEAVTQMIDADTYTYTFTAATDGNYSGEVTVDFVINQATATIVEPTKINLTYNATDQALVTEGTTDAVAGTEAEPAGKVEYQVTFGNEVLVPWTEDYAAVVGYNAGDYQVKYRITASEKNYTNPLIEDDVDVEILRAKIGYNLSNLEKTWNGKPFTKEEIASLFTLYAGELKGADVYNVPFVLTLPEPLENYVDAGPYTFKQGYANFEDNPVNYDVNFSGEATIVINKADLVEEKDFTAPGPVLGMKYNGGEFELVTGGEVKTTYNDEPIGVILYATSEDGKYSETVPAATDANTYNIWWYVKGDKNHNDFVPEAEALPIESTIAPAADAVFELAFEDATLDYNTTDQIPEGYNTVTINEGETTLEKGKDFDVVITYIPENGEASTNVLTALSGATSFNPEENYDKLFDGMKDTKWGTFAGGEGETVYVICKTSSAIAATSYELVIANDTYHNQSRNWKSWKIYGANFEADDDATANAEGWVLLDDKQNQDMTTDQYAVVPFSLSAPDGKFYSYYKIVVEAIVDPNFNQYCQMADFKFTEFAVKNELVNAGKYEFAYTGIGNYAGAEAKRTIVINPAELTEDMLSEFTAKVAYDGTDQKPEITLSFENDAPLTVDKDYTVVIKNKNGEDVTATDEFINADTYTFTFTGMGNYTSTDPVEVDFEITPLEVIAQAADAEKVYDRDSWFAELPEMTYAGVLKDDVVEFDASEAFTIEDESADAGTYTFTVDAEKIKVTPANYKVSAANGANFTIQKKNLMVNFNLTDETVFTKEYGTEDGDLVATADNLVITDDADEVIAAEKAQIIAETIIERAEGEKAGKYAVTLTAETDEDGNYVGVFANYDVKFTGAENAFIITPAEITLALAPQEKPYDGEDAAVDVTVDKLIVTGLKLDDTKEAIFAAEGAELPKAIVEDAAAVAGEYTVNLEGGKVANYTFKPLSSIFTINKATVTSATIETVEALKGQAVEDLELNFEVEGTAKPELFTVEVASKYQKEGVISAKSGTYTDGLVLVPVSDEAKANIEGWQNRTGKLVVVESIVLSDATDFITEAKSAATVTFTERAINTNNWNVVALPFDATVAEISDAFGYAAVDVLNENATDGNIHFQIKTTGTIAAHTPFIIKTTDDEDLRKEDFTEVVFEKANGAAIEIPAWDGSNFAVEDLAGNKFWGTFQASTEIYGQKYWYMSKGAWKDARNFTAEKPVTLKPFRAFVEFDEKNVAAGARIYIEEPDGTETAIDAVEFNNMVNGDTYTVGGMKVNKPAQKGIYIQNGKKVAVK